MDNSPTPVASFIPITTPHQKRLLEDARKILSDRGVELVLDELTHPVTDIPAHLLPYIVVALQQLQDHPTTTETVAIPHHPTEATTTQLLRTTCESIDQLLGGGLPVGTGAIFELSGRAGVGKTHIGAQLALMAPAPLSSGGLDSPSIYVFTEGRPPIRRLEAIDTALTNKLNLPERSLLQGVVVEKILSSDALLQFTEHRLPYLLRQVGARLVVVDSITAVYRPEFADPLSRADHLIRMATALRRCVSAVKGVCVCINQVSQALDGMNTLNATVPALGQAWSNCVATRFFVRRIRGRRYIRVTHSSYLPTTEGPGNPFLITSDGAVDEN